MAYLSMALAGLVLTLMTASAEERGKNVLARFATAAAVIALADWVAYGWLQLYTYLPHLLAVPYADSVLGEFLADLLLVPGLAVFIDRFLPGTAAGVAGALLVTGTEYLAIRAGLFAHHGWRLWYTAVGFVPYFTGLNYVWEAARRGRISVEWAARAVRLSVVFDMVVLLALFLRATRLAPTHVLLMPTWAGSQAFGRFLMYGLVTVPLGYWVACASGRSRWWRVGITFAIMYTENVLLVRTNLQVFLPPYSGAIDVVAQVSAIIAASLIQDWIGVAHPEVFRL